MMDQDRVPVKSAGGNGGVSREFLFERDSRIFALKKSGLSNVEIGRRFNISASSVGAAVRRVLGRLNSEAFLSYPEVLRLELERLDELQRSLWPLCQFRREVLDDGSEVVVEPDVRAVGSVLGVMDRRARLLGLFVDRQVVDVDVSGVGGVVSSLVGVGGGGSGGVGGDVRGESLRLLELMGSVGVLDEGVVAGVLESVGGGVVEGVVVSEVDGDVVDDVVDVV